MKLYYPENGLKFCTSNNVTDLKTGLYQAKSSCDFDIPGDFRYAGYLRGLPNVINNFVREAERIESNIQSVNSNYERVSDNLLMKDSRIEISKIVERDRMIV